MTYLFLILRRVTVLLAVLLFPLSGVGVVVAEGSDVVVTGGEVSVPLDGPVGVVVGSSVAVVGSDVAVGVGVEGGLVEGGLVEDGSSGRVAATSSAVAPGVVETATKAPQPLIALVSRLMVLVPLVPQEE
jgi:hypothetical protein